MTTAKASTFVAHMRPAPTCASSQRTRALGASQKAAALNAKPHAARFAAPNTHFLGGAELRATRRGIPTAGAMPDWWPFGKDKEGDASEEYNMVEVERIQQVQFRKDEQGRVIGLDYLLKWKDGAPDSWEPAQNVAEDLLRDFEARWWAAAKSCDEFALREMLSYGEEVLLNSVDDEGRTALHYVCGKGNERCVKALLEFEGIEMNSGDKDGYTPLHIAAGYMYQGVVRLLVKNGADPEKKDKANRSPIELIKNLKVRLPESAPEFWKRRNQLEDVNVALMTEVYEEIPVGKILDKRTIKMSTGITVTPEMELQPGEPTEDQYLVRWADSEDEEEEPEWIPAESVAEDVVADYEAGLEYCDAKAILEKKMINDTIHYKVEWEDGSEPSWEPMYHLSDAVVREYEAAHPTPTATKELAGSKN